MNILIATGGTGGHIDPALALAQILKEKESCRIHFVGSSNRMEAEIIPAAGYQFTGMQMYGTNGGFSQKIKSAQSLIEAGKQCRQMLKEEKPDICIGFGNYISVPLIHEAHRMHIRTMIHEQNSYAGKANKYLSRTADAVVCCYSSCMDSFPKEKTRLLGNPMATLASGYHRDNELIRSYGMNPDLPLVIVMAGSLGSETVSSAVDQACSLFDPDFQVLIASGKDNPYQFQYPQNKRIRRVPYLQGARMLASCDLAITRAGATTLAETAACGCCSILIPSPFVPNNHQVYNAMELVNRDAAVMIEEKDLSAQNLADHVNQLMADPKARERMKKNAAEMGKPNAAYDMISWIKELVQNGSDSE